MNKRTLIFVISFCNHIFCIAQPKNETPYIFTEKEGWSVGQLKNCENRNVIYTIHSVQPIVLFVTFTSFGCCTHRPSGYICFNFESKLPEESWSLTWLKRCECDKDEDNHVNSINGNIMLTKLLYCRLHCS